MKKSQRILVCCVLLLLTALLGDPDAHRVAASIDRASTTCSPSVNGNRAGEGETTHALAYAGDTSTFFKSNYDDWQYIQIDFSCVGAFNGLRRFMSRDGSDTTSHRGPQGDGL